ncbi:MAG: acetyl-CoA carboxylase biotin carboxylase subunit [Anaerocolumna sp.]
MFNKVLIANRGEIAVRIIRSCRELGLSTVAVCSEADRLALHAQIADETICIGPADSRESYLNIPAILSACSIAGAGALHPGFGFLSENAEFARRLEQCGIKYIGPKAEVIEQMGNKIHAKQLMNNNGIPVIPGSEGIIDNVEDAGLLAADIGYPILIKASAGGGGKGIRLVLENSDLEKSFFAAQQEAENYFGDKSVYIEKYLLSPRHIEIQILADCYGNVVHLGERDCSLQRRNQKVLEESPSPASQLSKDLRQRMGNMAVEAAKVCNYQNAGTIEFLLDSYGNFYFMEMNTRIQVEHPITEMVTGIDIVKSQIKIAQGKTLEFSQNDVVMRGHAIECRINAESPEKQFRPSPGTIKDIHIPGGPGIRVDDAIYAGYTIPPHYDNMIAKLIAYAPTRNEAIAKMKWALSEFLIDGVDVNIDFLLKLINTVTFTKGDYNIQWLNQYIMERKEG